MGQFIRIGTERLHQHQKRLHEMWRTLSVWASTGQIGKQRLHVKINLISQLNPSRWIRRVAVPEFMVVPESGIVQIEEFYLVPPGLTPQPHPP